MTQGKKNPQSKKKHPSHFDSKQQNTAKTCDRMRNNKDRSKGTLEPLKAQTPKNADVSTHNANTHVRINKALADAGVCSRRKAEEYIINGRVSVNGHIITDLAHKITAHDDILVDGKHIERRAQNISLLLHKPIHTICTANDPEGRTTIFDILPPQWRDKRLFTVGRLDYFSEGLLIITNDGHLAQKLAHPRHHLSKTYHVYLREEVTQEHLAIMRKGMRLAEGEVLAPVEARILKNIPAERRGNIVEMTLHQGINRQIRRMCRDLQLTILKLVRVSQGPVHLGELPVGSVRTLTENELMMLQKGI